MWAPNSGYLSSIILLQLLTDFTVIRCIGVAGSLWDVGTPWKPCLSPGNLRHSHSSWAWTAATGCRRFVLAVNQGTWTLSLFCSAEIHECWMILISRLCTWGHSWKVLMSVWNGLPKSHYCFLEVIWATWGPSGAPFSCNSGRYWSFVALLVASSVHSTGHSPHCGWRWGSDEGVSPHSSSAVWVIISSSGMVQSAGGNIIFSCCSCCSWCMQFGTLLQYLSNLNLVFLLK